MSLCTLYYNPEHPASFSSVARLVKASISSKRDVENWLAGPDTYTLHKPFRKRFPRNPYTVTTLMMYGKWILQI
jgi:hypothetical protein